MIKTIYVQHASVSEAFPALHFTYSFLDGRDSYAKYTMDGKDSKGNIILLGAARYDSLGRYRKNRRRFSRMCIGVGVNTLDSIDIVNKFCLQLLDAYPGYKIRVRLHPALKVENVMLLNDERITCVNAAEERIIDYLDNIDFQVTSDSALHLNAVIGGVRTIAYNFTDHTFADNYGYVARGFVKLAETIEDICNVMAEIGNPSFEKISFFNCAYGRDYEGTCSKVIANFIVNNYSMDYLCKVYGFAEKKGEPLPYYDL